MTTDTAPPATGVHDPVCGMPVDPAAAVAERTVGETTCYFCSERCVQQFDGGQAASATTGVATTGGWRSIELPIAELDGRHGAERLGERLIALPGVRDATVNATTRLARVEYHPAATNVKAIVDGARAAGYTVGTATARIGIAGIRCGSCVAKIEQALGRTPGVVAAVVNIATEQASVEYLPGLVNLEQLGRAIEAGGYRLREAPAPTEPAIDREEQGREREYRSVMRKWWFGAAVAAPTMILSYPWLFPILRDILPRGSDQLRLVWGVIGLFSLAVLAYSGSQFFVGAWRGLRHRSANMHTLIALGTGVAWLYSTIALVFPWWFPGDAFTEVYYDVTAVVTALVVLGLALELKAKGRTSEAIKKLIGLQARTARVVRDGREVDIPVEEVLVGDTVVVRPGEKIPGREGASRARPR